MAIIVNTASLQLVGANAPKPVPTVDPWILGPGEKAHYGNSDGTPAYFYFYTLTEDLWHEGYIRDGHITEVNSDTRQLEIIGQVLTQRDLDGFKALYPDSKRIQALTLQELQERYKPSEFRGYQVLGSPDTSTHKGSLSVKSCEYAIAVVVIDCIFVLTGAIGLHGKISPKAVEEVAKLIEPVMNELEEAVDVLATTDSNLEKAKAIKNIVHVIWSGSLIEAVYKAIMDDLTWWDGALYGSLGIATIAAAFLTDGAALVAVIVAEMAQIGFVISDAAKATEACKN